MKLASAIVGLAFVCAACTSSKPVPDANETPSPDAVPGVEPGEPARAMLTRDECVAFTEGVLASTPRFTVAGVTRACAAEDDPASLAVAALTSGKALRCPEIDEEDLLAIDRALAGPTTDDDPYLGGRAADRLRECSATLAAALMGAPDMASVCAPERPGVGDRDRNALAGLDTTRAIGRLLALRVVDLARARRMGEAIDLTLRAVELGQAAGRGQVSFIDAAMAAAMTQPVLERLRIELASRPGALPIADLQPRVDRLSELLAAEPELSDVIRGDHLGFALQALLPMVRPDHPALAGGDGAAKGSALDGLETMREQMPGVDDPLAIICSAAIASTRDMLAACDGDPKPGPARCRAIAIERSDELAKRRSEALGSSETLARAALADPTRAPELAFDLAYAAMGVSMPDLAERGRALASLRLRLEIGARFGPVDGWDACPTEVAFAGEPWSQLRTTRFAEAPLELAVRDRSVLVVEDAEHPTRQDEDRWRWICIGTSELAELSAPIIAERGPVDIRGTPHDEECTEVNLKWLGRGPVELRERPGRDEPVLASVPTKRGAAVDYDESIVRVHTPGRLKARTDLDLGRNDVLDVATGELTMVQQHLRLAAGDELRVYHYEGEGQCDVGYTAPDGVEVITVLNCPYDEEQFEVVEGEMDRPASYDWWVRVTVGGTTGWLRPLAPHVDVHVITHSMH